MKFIYAFLFLLFISGCQSVPVSQKIVPIDGMIERIQRGDEIKIDELIDVLKYSKDTILNQEIENQDLENDLEQAKDEARTWRTMKFTFWFIMFFLFGFGLYFMIKKLYGSILPV